MAFRNYVLLAAAGALLAAPLAATAQAATTTHKPMRHSTMHRAAPHSRMTGTTSPSNADHSADSLNAQSLQRAQAPQ